MKKIDIRPKKKGCFFIKKHNDELLEKKIQLAGSPRVLFEDRTLLLWEIWWNFDFEINFFFYPLSKKRFYNRFTFLLLLAVPEDLNAQSSRLQPIKRYLLNPIPIYKQPGILNKLKYKKRRSLNLKKQFKLLMALIKSNIEEYSRKNIKVKPGAIELYSPYAYFFFFNRRGKSLFLSASSREYLSNHFCFKS